MMDTWDSRNLNKLVHPVEAIKDWQMAGHP